TAKFDFTSAPMPYYPDVAGAPQNSIIGGASLWVMGGKKPEEYKGVAKFFAFLSDTNRQAKLHQESGYLPITKAAYEKSIKDGFYEKNPTLQTPLKELTNKEPTQNSRGLRFGNMVQMRDVWAEEIEAALAQPEYYTAMLTTVVFSTLVAALSLAIALLFATQADKNLKAAQVYKTFMIWPYAVAPAVAGVLWIFMFQPSLGTLAQPLR